MDADEMERRAEADGGRLREDMTGLGYQALEAVLDNHELDPRKVLDHLQFMRKVKFNQNYDLISKHDIARHLARHGVSC